MEYVLEVEGVTKKFGSLMALNDVSFSVRKGEVIGLIGPNGAGKTTLFNCMCGFYESSSGSIIFKGQNITKASPDKLVKLGMARTFQIPRPFRELTVSENISVGTLFSAAERRSDDLDPENVVDNILRGVDLYSFKDELAGILSYGNLKKLELGRVQGPKPDLMLLDEPFAGLSADEIDNCSRIIKKLTDGGLTVIIVEHKLRELMKLVNRVIVLFYGGKIADGKPEDISKNEQVLKAYLGRRWSKNAGN
jgi:branched-chain amino acid transport system ATP-binding protein